MAEGFI